MNKSTCQINRIATEKCFYDVNVKDGCWSVFVDPFEHEIFDFLFNVVFGNVAEESLEYVVISVIVSEVFIDKVHDSVLN